MSDKKRNKLYGYSDRYAHEHVVEDQLLKKAKIKKLRLRLTYGSDKRKILLNKEHAQNNERVLTVTKAQHKAYELIREYGKPVKVDTLRAVGVGLSTIKALKSKQLIKITQQLNNNDGFKDDVVELIKQDKVEDMSKYYMVVDNK